MWLICVLAFITLDIVFAKNVLQKNEDLLNPIQLDDRTLDYIDKGIGNSELRWPLGNVQYFFDHSSYDYLVAERVRLAMNTIEETSCVRFTPILEPWSESYWVHITNKDMVRECTHETAVNGTGLEIVMRLGIDCLRRRDILHLLMHAMGFKDEITHPQRDQYVRILWDNINPVYRHLFRIAHENFPTRTTEYDPMSIMHFHDRAFTKNGQATIASLVPGLVINPSRELSPLDKMKLRLMFGHECNRREVGDFLDSCKTALHDGKYESSSEDEKTETDAFTEKNQNIEGPRPSTDEEVKNYITEDNETKNSETQSTEEEHHDDSAARAAKV